MTATQSVAGRTKRQSKYRVTLRYREPSYERVTGPRAEPYRWTFPVDAETTMDALAEAIGAFRDMERLSSAGWHRKIVRAEIDCP